VNVVSAGDHDDAHRIVVTQLVERPPDLRGTLSTTRSALLPLFAQMLLDANEFDRRDLAIAADVQETVVGHEVGLPVGT